MKKNIKGLLGILAGVGLLGAGAFTLAKKNAGDESDGYAEEYECEDEETEVETVEESE